MLRICCIFSFAVCAIITHAAAADDSLMPNTMPKAMQPVTLQPAPMPPATMQPTAMQPAMMQGTNWPTEGNQSPCPCMSHCNCHSPPAYNLAPGCCEPRRHCFDNAWDGYCEHRAKWDTFWCKVGTGALCPCSHCYTRDGRSAAMEVEMRPGAAAYGCQNR